jgi:hypothetical protein
MGWPPPEPYGDHRWGRLLGQRPLAWWKDVTWALEKTDCGEGGVMDIRKEWRAATRARPRSDAGTLVPLRPKRRLVPGPPVVMGRPECLSPIDGTHRMAVLSGLRLLPGAALAAKKLAKPSKEQNVWMGRHADGELPNVP